MHLFIDEPFAYEDDNKTEKVLTRVSNFCLIFVAVSTFGMSVVVIDPTTTLGSRSHTGGGEASRLRGSNSRGGVIWNFFFTLAASSLKFSKNYRSIK